MFEFSTKIGRKRGMHNFSICRLFVIHETIQYIVRVHYFIPIQTYEECLTLGSSNRFHFQAPLIDGTF